MKRYTMLYIIQGKVEEIQFNDWAKRDDICEDIQVSEGEEGRMPKFICIIDTESKEVIEKSERLRR